MTRDLPIRWAGIVKESVVDGPGLRAVVFFQGCPHRCPGCHNPETWDEQGGHLHTVGQVWEYIQDHPLLRGITLSGGEPFCQPAAGAELARLAKDKGWEVMVYTGYLWEELVQNPQPQVRELLKLTDILVDGPFILAQRDLGLKFRGSGNQRLINVPASLVASRPVLWEGDDDGLV